MTWENAPLSPLSLALRVTGHHQTVRKCHDVATKRGESATIFLFKKWGACPFLAFVRFAPFPGAVRKHLAAGASCGRCPQALPSGASREHRLQALPAAVAPHAAPLQAATSHPRCRRRRRSPPHRPASGGDIAPPESSPRPPRPPSAPLFLPRAFRLRVALPLAGVFTPNPHSSHNRWDAVPPT